MRTVLGLRVHRSGRVDHPARLQVPAGRGHRPTGRQTVGMALRPDPLAFGQDGRAALAMAGLIARGGPMRLRPPRDPDHFVDLAETIVYQQLAGSAARAIWGRVAALFDGRITPSAVLATSDEAFRAAGLSRNKAVSIRDLAQKVADGTVPLEDIRRLSDDEIVARLSTVRGIGRWTAEMFLIFQLRRLDVWPVDDYGVRKGWAVIHGLDAWPKPKQLL